MSGGKSKLRFELFEDGVQIIHRISSPLINAYVCPLCVRLFGDDALKNGQLTIEHIPPKSVGAQSVLLTCASCNNEAGSRLDSHLAKYKATSEFAKGIEITSQKNRMQKELYKDLEML